MACPRYDFHIHTKHLGCANETMEVAAIIRECERLGVKAVGITDHLNRFDQVELHAPIRAAIESLEADLDVYFGVELNYMSFGGEFPYDADIKEKCGFQFAIGGIHCPYLTDYDPLRLVEVQHWHHLKTCGNPLVDVLVHPYWFGEGEFKRNGWPWAEWLRHVPEACARELGRVARDTGTAIEINACANLTNPRYPDDFARQYVEYLALVADEGPMFAVGSDAHDLAMLSDVAAAWQVVEELGLGEDRIWCPRTAPLRSSKPRT